jgi:hypothetical protein
LLNGYIPSLGDTFRIFSFTSSTGLFASASMPVLPSGLYWNIHYNPDNISLAIVNIAPLPLTFISIKATNKDEGIQIEWNTEMEVNVQDYKVERSTDGAHFSEVGAVKAIGSGANHYSWLDASPANGNNFYRVKAVDMDGQFKYTSVVTVRTTNTGISAYPNPVKRGETLQLSLGDTRAGKIEVINVPGQVLYNKEGHLTGTINIPIPASWPAGKYLLRVISDKVTIRQILIY